MYNTIQEIRDKNRSINHHFFSGGALRFFNSRIGDTVYKKKYFITSERYETEPRKFSVRYVTSKGDIETIGNFNSFDYKYQAEKFIESLPDLLPEFIEAAKLFWNTEDKETFRDLAENHYSFIKEIKKNAVKWDLVILFKHPIQSTCLIDIEV